MSDFILSFAIFLFVLGGALIGIGYFLGRKIAPLHVMIYFMSAFAFLIGTLVLFYPEAFERILS